jgi:hypothetical protein
VQTSSVPLRRVDVEEVVAVGDVDYGEREGCDAKDDRGDEGIGYC